MAVPRALTGRIAAQAYPISAVLAGLAVVFALAGGALAALVAATLAALNLAFFRNPNREIPGDERTVVAPADGRIVEVAQLEDPEGFVGVGWRVAIFLSIFNVHINRVPLSGKVRAVRRSGSRFLAAFNPRASRENVQCRLDLEAAGGTRLAVVQLTGLVARRIVCDVREGDELVRGEPYGLICYGSRVELYLPASARIRVERGQKIKGGRDVVAELPS